MWKKKGKSLFCLTVYYSPLLYYYRGNLSVLKFLSSIDVCNNRVLDSKMGPTPILYKIKFSLVNLFILYSWFYGMNIIDQLQTVVDVFRVQIFYVLEGWHKFTTNWHIHHHQSVLPKGRSFTANSGTKAAVLFKGRSYTANVGSKDAVLLGMNRCGSFPFLSAPHSLFSMWADLKRSGKIPGAPTWRWGEWTWLTGLSGLHWYSP